MRLLALRDQVGHQIPGFGESGLCFPRSLGVREGIWCGRRRGRRKLTQGAGAGLDDLGQFLDFVVGAAVLRHLLADLAVRVHHGGVVLAAELVADLGEGEFGQFAAQVHRDLAGVRHLAGFTCADELVHRDVEVLGGVLLDGGGVDVDVAFVGEDVAKGDLGDVEGDGLVDKGRVGRDPDEGALELADRRLEL